MAQKLTAVYDKWNTNVPIPSTIQNAMNMDLNTNTFFPSFFNSMTTIQHKKSTITININFQQLKSTKCFKYIKCSISNSLVVEKMLARLNREAVCNNHLLLCTKLMKLLLCDICYGCYNALNDSKRMLLFHE